MKERKGEDEAVQDPQDRPVPRVLTSVSLYPCRAWVMCTFCPYIPAHVQCISVELFSLKNAGLMKKVG